MNLIYRLVVPICTMHIFLCRAITVMLKKKAGIIAYSILFRLKTWIL